MKAISKAIAFLLLLISLFYFSNLYALDYVMGVTRFSPAYPPPTKYTRGTPTTDAVFGTTVVRLTDYSDTPSGSAMHVTHSAKWSPENSNGTRALLCIRTGSLYKLYNVDKASPYCYTDKDNNGKALLTVNLCVTDCGSRQFYTHQMEPRWSHTDPNIIYFPYGVKFYTLNISTGAYTLIHNFALDYPTLYAGYENPTYETIIFNDDEGRQSADDRYWAFNFARFESGNLVKKNLFCYDRQQDKIVGTLDEATMNTRHGGINWVSMSVSGTYVVVGTDYGTWQTSRYTRDFTDGLPLNSWANHSDLGVDTDGNDVLVGYDVGGHDGMNMVRLSDAHFSMLLPRPWPNPNDITGGSYGHVSANHNGAKPGWAVWSTYTGNSNVIQPGTKFDPVLIFMMQLKDRGAYTDWVNTNSIPTGHLPYVWQVAHHYNCGSCWQSHAVMNDAGTRIYFTSPWIYNGDTESCPIYGGTDHHDTYIVEIPSTWWTDLGGLSSFVAQPLHPPSPPTGLKIIK